MYVFIFLFCSHNSSEASLDARQKLGQLSEESCLVLGQFCINELCVYLSGRGELLLSRKSGTPGCSVFLQAQFGKLSSTDGFTRMNERVSIFHYKEETY